MAGGKDCFKNRATLLSLLVQPLRKFQINLQCTSIKTSNKKYLQQAIEFYDAIHERQYFSPSSNQPADASLLAELESRFMARYTLALILLGNYHKAHAISRNDTLKPIIDRLLAEEVHNLPSAPPNTSVAHAVIILDCLTANSCLLQTFLDKCKPPITRTVLTCPSFPELSIAISSSFLKHPNGILLLWVESKNQVITNDQIELYRRRNYQIAFKSPLYSNFETFSDELLNFLNNHLKI